ncbi:chitin synthase [Halteromyces radiatus]|uniref:chitin synthase n=1 Tax=Halteromyces radiatus TaxID=101107 RepID=UPI00221EA120|nr:chitin synthase [Halteromyces radiatus]KAI8084779.1 chitin synthase [Halteromyces radiatus]
MQDDRRTDLTCLLTNSTQPPSEDNIVNLLQTRYKRNQPYTQLGHFNLIVLNPYQPLDILNDATLQSYADYGYRNISGQKPFMQPHIYDMATRIYFHMRRTGEDQTIILSGITGSGKSTTKTHLLNQLLFLSTHSKKESKLQHQIKNALVILESFGHAKTCQNNSASKFGMFQELQFSERGRIQGAKTLTYYFDKSRVTSVPKDERSFNVFYQLLAGTSTDEQAALHINFDPDHFHYLGHSKCIQVQGINDSIGFSDLKSALKVCGFKAKTVTQIFQLLAAIMHLGNLQFGENRDGGMATQEACNVRNTDELELVSAMLGVSPSKLETSLTYKLRLIRKELCTMFLNPQGAIEQRDALARALYHVLFLWIVESINTKICYTDQDEPANFIGILDQFGFQNFKTNGFEEFCANFANERIHQYVIQRQFNDSEGINAAMTRDGLYLNKVITMDNSGCLELLIGKEKDLNNSNESSRHIQKSASLGLGGIMGVMDRDCAKYQTGATDATEANFLANVQRQYGSHPSYAKSGYAYAFGINHFSGTVHYTVDAFLEKNLDDLSPDFVNLLRDSSTNMFVSTLFQSSVMATESHPKDDRTIVKAQLSNKPTRAPSMKRPNKRRINGNTISTLGSTPMDLSGGETTGDNPSPGDTEDNLRQQKLISNKDTEDAYQNMQMTTVTDQLYMTLRDLFNTMSDTTLYNIIHIRPNDTLTPDTFDPKRVKVQIRAFLLPDLTLRCRQEYVNYYTFAEFLLRYHRLVQSLQIDEETKSQREQVETTMTIMNWTDDQATMGNEMIWLSHEIWRELEDGLRVAEKEERERLKTTLIAQQQQQQPLDPAIDYSTETLTAGLGDDMMENHQDGNGNNDMHNLYYGDKQQLNYLNSTIYNDDNGEHLPRSSFFEDNASYAETEDGMKREGSQWGDESEWGMKGLSEGFGPNMDMSKMVEDYQTPQHEQVEEMPITAVRIWWVRFVWLMTWWIPSPFLRWFGKMKREDVQMAWREKVTLCIVIFFFSSLVIFVIVGLGEVVCPGTRNMYSPANIKAHGTPDDMYMSVRGVAYDVTNFAIAGHGTTAHNANKEAMGELAGLDVSYTIPPPLTVACQGLVSNPAVQVIPNQTIDIGPFKHLSGDQLVETTLADMKDSMWYWNTFIPNMKLYKKGTVVIQLSQLQTDFQGWGRKAMAINKRVYDITDYLETAKNFDSGAGGGDYHFLSPAVEEIFNKFSGGDATIQWNKYKGAMSATEQAANLNCLDNFFYIGDVDERESPRCTFTNYLLLSFACIMCLVILVKFLAALQFGGAPTPEDHDKFVICQVPCYTEDEESLRKTFDSLTVLNYDDKRKLLLIIADGMIMGSGNDRPTPRIVLDVLGYDTKNDPEPLMFKSIGEGSKQLNYGKVYSGLYECEGHVVPYVVIVKVGKASERAKPGNRGKRDSQMICMNFLNKVHFDGEMTPLELEVYHQIKNVIGVNPSFYEYILMVDSDTEVLPDALNHMISCMLHDGRIIGLCGETKLVNEDRSWTTMIQVYEYYISHHLAKAFESLFGSVTCLPGCFCMYRIRTPVKNEPLIISPKVIQDYSDNHVDTLHKKNLLHLGEDRYLTTLMMKHFPSHKMKFTSHAQCKTVAPDRWKILLSQRRRWINSTIHNLFEVVLLPDLCGFCCFSMRFVVLIDLIGTLTLPVSVVYLAYLIYVIASGTGPIPILAMCMLAGIYGLQAILFILKRQWQHIGWMFFYILAIPVFSFFLPIYSFWHFDDFSWGNTRVVVGDNKQKKIIVADDEKFDEKMIPLKKWSVYEQELWELGSTGSKETGVTGQSYRSYYTHGGGGGGGSVIGGGYDTRSQYGSQMDPGGDYDYYRDTNIGGDKPRNSRSRSPMPMMSGYPGSVISGAPMDMTPPLQRGSRTMSLNSFGPDLGQFANTMMNDRGSIMGYPQQPSSGIYQNFMGSRSSLMQPGQPHDLDLQLRPMSQFSVPLSQGGLAPMIPPGFPTDDDILAEIRNILATANLMSVTKKQVREQLSTFFGFDMTPKKEFINSSIEYILRDRL